MYQSRLYGNNQLAVDTKSICLYEHEGLRPRTHLLAAATAASLSASDGEEESGESGDIGDIG